MKITPVVVKTVKEAISKDLSSRYQTEALKQVVNITAILDPRYKELPFLSGSEAKKIFDDLEQLLIDMHLPHDSGDSSEERNEEQSSSPTESPAKRPRINEEDVQEKSKFSKLLGDIFQSESSPPRLAVVDRVRREISLYKAEHVADLDSNPLKWWNDRKHTYPLIVELVKKCLQWLLQV